MDSYGQTALLLRTRLTCLKAKIQGSLLRFPMTFLAMGVLLAGYLGSGYWLMSKGLGYAHRLVQVGDILTERIMALLFFLFFLMLIFSNAVLLFLSLFRSKETRWMLTLPISHKAIFSLRILESLVVSSWGLLVLSFPIFLAYGRVQEVGLIFYAKSMGLLILFIAIPACLAGLAVTLLVRFLPLSRKWLLAMGVAVLVFFFTFVGSKLKAVTDVDLIQAASEVTAFTDALRHTEVSMNPWFPSAWMTEAVVNWAGIQNGDSRFATMLVASYSAMALLVAISLGGGLFYSAWSRSVSRAAQGVHRREEKSASRKGAIFAKSRESNIFTTLTGKDLKLFIRDPAQWVQCFVVVSLLLVYVLNIRNLGYDYESPKWLTVVTYLNFAVSALALSTLTTRFVFPQFSLEGQKLWIVGVAPMKLVTVLWQKFWVSFLVTGAITTTLMIVSGTMLRLPLGQGLYFIFGMLILALGLTSLAVGMGTLVPDFRESNPARLVSGFGGTLCLIGSFVLIIVTVVLLAAPDVIALMRGFKEGGVAHLAGGESRWAWFAASVVLTTVVSVSVLALSVRKINRLDF